MSTDEMAGEVPASDLSNRKLVRAIWLTAVALALALAALGIYYVRVPSASRSSAVIDRDIRAMESSVRERPNDPELRVSLANLYNQKGRPEEAISQAEQVLKVNPKHLGATLVVAEAWLQNGRSDLAVQYLTRVIELNKDNPMARSSLILASVHQRLGRIYLQQGHNDTAVSEFRQDLSINPGDADALHLMGKALAAQGKLDEAIQSYQEALRFDPEFPEVYGDLVRAYEDKGDLDRAQYAWGMVNYSLGEYDQAARRLQQALDAVPGMSEAHLGLAMVYEKQGLSSRALEEYRKALAGDSRSVAARHGIARLGGQP